MKQQRDESATKAWEQTDKNKGEEKSEEQRQAARETSAESSDNYKE